jgi:hypothetical protein
MKRRALALLMILVVLSSQAASAKGFLVGIKGGLFTANTTSVPTGMSNNSFKSGFAGGVSLGYAFNDYFSLEPEILYVQKGLKGTVSNIYVTGKLTGSYDYVEVPVLAKLTMSVGSRVSPFVFFGPSLGINVKADVQTEYSSERFQQTWTQSTDYSPVTNKAEISVVFGGGLRGVVGPGAITLDGRFDLGLSNVTKGGDMSAQVNGVEQIMTVPASTSKNIGFALMLGYAF